MRYINVTKYGKLKPWVLQSAKYGVASVRQALGAERSGDLSEQFKAETHDMTHLLKRMTETLEP